jgi:uncharacterized membrane protein YphA (DoxX/SURF4 family)
MRISGAGHVMFAIGAASIAIVSIAFGDFAPMWRSIPVWIPGREIWLYGSAVVLLAASAGLCFSRTAVPSLLAIGAYQTMWAVMGVSPILSNPLSIGSWYGLCEASTSLAGAWILWAILRSRSQGPEMSMAAKHVVRVAQVLFGLTCIFYGCSHFAYADYTASMVPAWLPGGLGFAYLTGFGHIAAGVGIVIGILPRLAATLEAIMMSLFGLLVWVPSFLAQPRPKWAGTPQNQWSELLVNILLAAAAWIVADSMRNRSWGRSMVVKEGVEPSTPAL